MGVSEWADAGAGGRGRLSARTSLRLWVGVGQLATQGRLRLKIQVKLSIFFGAHLGSDVQRAQTQQSMFNNALTIPRSQ